PLRRLPVRRRRPAGGDLLPPLSRLGAPGHARSRRGPGELRLPPGPRRLQGEGVLRLPAPPQGLGADGARGISGSGGGAGAGLAPAPRAAHGAGAARCNLSAGPKVWIWPSWYTCSTNTSRPP